MGTIAKRQSGPVFEADYHTHVRHEMETNRFDYVRGFLSIILSYLGQGGTVRITDSLEGWEETLASTDDFDGFLDAVNQSYGASRNIRFERENGVIRAIRLDEEETLLKPITDAIVDEVHPEAVILFGSRASGADRPGSDVDLLVVIPDSHEDRGRRRKLTGRIQRRLAGMPVAADVLVYTRSEVEQWRDAPGHIINTSMEQGRPLYGHA